MDLESYEFPPKYGKFKVGRTGFLIKIGITSIMYISSRSGIRTHRSIDLHISTNLEIVRVSPLPSHDA